VTLADPDAFIALVAFNDRGLVPCIVQDEVSGEVLMMAWANAEAMRLTLTTAEAHFFSRSRDQLWHKGATSGNVQHVVSVALDCDHDTVLLRVRPAGPACHTGAVGCFREEACGGAAFIPAPPD
jgi:phosphoribosyl-AMP cyclohydrolase